VRKSLKAKPDVEWQGLCFRNGMILLITNSSHQKEIAGTLQKELAEETIATSDLRGARQRLKDDNFAAVVLDESLFYSYPGDCEKLLEHTGASVPVLVNLGVHSAQRVARDVVRAVQRARRERILARQAVQWELRGQLRSDLTGLLVCMQQALNVPLLPNSVEAQLRSACMLADGMKAKLEGE